MTPVILIVMDGWGVNEKKEGNAILLSGTANLKRLSSSYPATELCASGNAVGLPAGQMGNSEVGHLTLGAGRVLFQEFTRINKAIEEGSFADNAVLNDMLAFVKKKGAALHLMGLISDGGVHSHIRHLYALIDAAKKTGVEKVFIHAFLDGRDTPPDSGRGYIVELQEYLKKAGIGEVSTISGRYYAMDRDKRWERVKKTYDAITLGQGVKAEDPVKAIEAAYRNNQTDEFMEPAVITRDNAPVGAVRDGDCVMFFNFRSDRARELTEAFIKDDFDGFKRQSRPRTGKFVTMTEYDEKFRLPAVFAPQKLKNILGSALSLNGVRQFRISETEKYAHVTFFFNGGVETPFKGEERLLIPSVRDVPTYDKKPEMRAAEIASAVVEKLKEGEYGFILVNFANGDMVGHTGVLDAAIMACKAVDSAVGRVVDAAIKNGFTAIITSDHGNVEQMMDYSTGAPHTAHTTNPVPFILVDEKRKGMRLKHGLGLSSVAPTVIKVMGLSIPANMDGEPLISA